MIEYKHVALRYTDKNILKDVNLRIENGEFMVLVGPSGSGKTTMIKMVNRLWSQQMAISIWMGNASKTMTNGNYVSVPAMSFKPLPSFLT